LTILQLTALCYLIIYYLKGGGAVTV
jgi:hypothetical protein